MFVRRAEQHLVARPDACCDHPESRAKRGCPPSPPRTPCLAPTYSANPCSNAATSRARGRASPSRPRARRPRPPPRRGDGRAIGITIAPPAGAWRGSGAGAPTASIPGGTSRVDDRAGGDERARPDPHPGQDGRVRADRGPVLDHGASEPADARGRIPVVREHHVRAEEDPVADHGVRRDEGHRLDRDVRADHGPPLADRVRPERDAVADPRLLADQDVVPGLEVVADLHLAVDDRARAEGRVPAERDPGEVGGAEVVARRKPEGDGLEEPCTLTDGISTEVHHSTVTLLARFLGWSTSRPSATAVR